MSDIKEAFEKAYDVAFLRGGSTISPAEIIKETYWACWQAATEAAQAESAQTIAEKDERIAELMSDNKHQHYLIVELEALLKKKDEAIKSMLGLNCDASRKTVARIGEEALSHTSPTDALERYLSPLSFEQIEDCFPEGATALPDGGTRVSAQWLHNFAANIRRMPKGNEMSDMREDEICKIFSDIVKKHPDYVEGDDGEMPDDMRFIAIELWQSAQAESAQTIAGLQALLKERDECLERLRKGIYSALPNGGEVADWVFGTADEALSHTSPTDALERYRNEVLEEAAKWFDAGSINADMSSRVFLKDFLKSAANELRSQQPASNTPAHVQQPTALIRRKAVEQLTGLSRSRIYDLMETGNFPRPARLGSMSVAWVETEVREWIADRIAERKTA